MLCLVSLITKGEILMHNSYKHFLFLQIPCHFGPQSCLNKTFKFPGQWSNHVTKSCLFHYKKETKYIIFLVSDKYFVWQSTYLKCKLFFKCIFNLMANNVIAIILNSQSIWSFIWNNMFKHANDTEISFLVEVAFQF